MTLKVLILAAGQKPLDSGTGALELQPLGDTTVLGHVIRNLNGLVAARDIIVVSDPASLKAIQKEVGWEPALVIQDTPLGTGHAVMQAADALASFEGDLLILYGDTPLLRPASLRGLLNRHRLKGVSLTLLTAHVALDLPYGRVRRDENGRILDIVEQTEADDETSTLMLMRLLVTRTSILGMACSANHCSSKSLTLS